MFGNFAKIASICMGFHPGTSHGYFFHSDFWPNLNFPLEHQIKLVLISKSDPLMVTPSMGKSYLADFPITNAQKILVCVISGVFLLQEEWCKD